MNPFKTITDFVGAAAFLGTTTVLAAMILSVQLPALQEGVELARCAVGVPSNGSICLKDKFRALENAQQQTEAERDKLAEQIAQYQTRQNELQQLGKGVENFNLFTTKELKFGTVSTGVRFASVLEPEVWSESWCYLERNHNGLPRQIKLGNQISGQQIVWATPSSAMLDDAGLTRAMLDEAQKACRFPQRDK